MRVAGGPFLFFTVGISAYGLWSSSVEVAVGLRASVASWLSESSAQEASAGAAGARDKMLL